MLGNPADVARGKNGLSARAAFYQRSLYADVKYPEEFPPPLDIWHNKLVYGRVNQSQRAVEVKPTQLANVRIAENPNFFLLKPVEEALYKFSLHMKKAVTMGAVDKNANPALLNLKAVRAYESPEKSYSYFTQRLYNSFAANVTGKENKNIVDFPSFMRYYKPYLLSVAAVTPVSMANYVVSSNCSLFTSGLSVALAKDDPASDFEKVNSYIRDPNFAFFRRCAKKFGFIVNKNAPWVLTADLFSDAFLETATGNFALLNGTTITENNFFPIFYFPAALSDMYNVASIALNSYRTFVQEQPYYDSSPDVSTRFGGANVATLGNNCPVEARPRKPMQTTSTLALYGRSPDVLSPRQIIDLYVDLRNAEARGLFRASKIRDIKREAWAAYKMPPPPTFEAIDMAALVIDSYFLAYLYGKGAHVLQFTTLMQQSKKELDISAASDIVVDTSSGGMSNAASTY